MRRLKRDAPELATALARGEFPSARAAGIAAGFVKPSPPSLQLKDPAPTAQKLLAKKGPQMEPYPDEEWAAILGRKIC